MRYGGIYEIKDSVSGKRYVGSSYDLRIRIANHKHTLSKGVHHNRMLQHAFTIRPNCFEFNILAILELDDQLPTEQRLLDIEHAKGRDTFNISKDAVSPMKGRTHTEEWKERSAVWRKGNKSRTGVPSHWKGKKLSPDHVAKIAASKTNPSAETRGKMRQAKLGIVPWNKGIHKDFCVHGHPMIGDNIGIRTDRGTRFCKECTNRSANKTKITIMKEV